MTTDLTVTDVFEKEPESEEELEWLVGHPSLSWCHVCFHRQALTCKAYPSGIPLDWLHGFDKHDTVQPDQVGEFVYQYDPESPYA